MKKTLSRTHKRTVTGRASTVSKGRSIHGLPCSLPVASWTLILLLLLTTSVSHVHDTGERGAENAADGAHEDYLKLSTGKKVILGGGAGGLIDSPQIIEDSNSGNPDTRQESTLSSASEAAGTGVVSERREQGQWIQSSVASPLDALQYAEYGAGLLHQTGAADEGSEACLVSNTGDTHRLELIYPDESAALESGKSSPNLPCKNEFLLEEHGQSLDKALLAQCPYVELRDDPKTCHYDRSLQNVFLHSSGAQEKPQEQQQGFADHSRDGETRTAPSTQTEVVKTADLLTRTPPSDVNSELLAYSDISLQEGELATINDGSDVECTHTVLQDCGILDEAHENVIEPPSRNDVHDGVEDDRGEGTLLPLIKIHTETSHGKVVDESWLSTYPDVKGGFVQTDLDDVLSEELESIISTHDEGSLLVGLPPSGEVETKNHLEPVKLRRVGQVMSLDEYKRSILEKQKLGKVVNLSTLQTPKTRHSDESYNYAASSHGAKVLSANKEAKGAAHIINSDKDKYLRNPCSAEDKFVVLELSEETFVDTIVIANFEFHSANVKEFEVYGSPVYPTKEWILLGKFHAENVRHRQRFTVEDPKLVRYVMLKMLSHWGTEFFCTLSAVQIFGVDVIKNLLDDWIASEEEDNGSRAQATGLIVHHEETSSDSQHSSAVPSDGALTETLGTQSSAEASVSPDSAGTMNKEKKVDMKDEESKTGDSVPEVHHVVGGKPPGDSVLKILMQKVKALELNQSLFDNYLEDTNTKYKAMLSELDKDLALLSKRFRNETAVSALLAIRLLDMESKMKEEKAYLEYQFSLVANNFTENMEFMRWQIQSMERREITAIMLALLSPILSAVLYLLAGCMPNKRTLYALEHPLQNEGVAGTTDSELDACSLHSVCKLSSSVILYIACTLIVLVLSV